MCASTTKDAITRLQSLVDSAPENSVTPPTATIQNYPSNSSCVSMQDVTSLKHDQYNISKRWCSTLILIHCSCCLVIDFFYYQYLACNPNNRIEIVILCSTSVSNEAVIKFEAQYIDHKF